MHEVLRERAEEGSQETAIEVVPEEIEVVVEEGEARAFYSNKGVKCSRSIWQRKVLWMKEDSRSWCHCLRRKSREEIRRS